MWQSHRDTMIRDYLARRVATNGWTDGGAA
jgi:hypothetical protein